LEESRDEIHVELPRATVGGLKKRPVEELLRRIAHDYAQLEQENRQLSESHDEGRPEPRAPIAGGPVAGEGGPPLAAETGTEPVPGAGERRDQLDGPAELEQDLQAGRAAALRPPHGTEELAAAVLALAQRAARDLRESTRVECELMIKKTRSHAAKLQHDLDRARASTEAEIGELEALKRELREQMRLSLQALLQTFVAERSGELPALDWHEILAAGAEAGSAGKRRHKKKPKA
jgi:cell division septum initiation protein DivIVA